MDIRGAGGTSGGVGQFFLGLALAGLGLYMFFSRVMVMTSFWTMLGRGWFGLVLIPLGVGMALLFFSARSVIGWVLTVGSLVTIFVSIVANLRFFFMPTNLFITIMMIGLIFIGFGMIIRSFKDYGQAVKPR